MQDGRSARAQRPRLLMTVHFTRHVARDTSVDSPERDGAEFEVELDALAKRQPVQLLPKLSDTGTMRRLCYRTSEQFLDTLKTVEVALRRTIEQTVTVIGRTDDANCQGRRHGFESGGTNSASEASRIFF